MNLKKVIGGLLAVLGVLWVIGRISSHSRKSDVPQTVQASPGDKWSVKEERSPMDDSQTVVLSLDSDDEIQGPSGKVRPSLIIRCKEKSTDLYVVTGMAASIEENLDGGPRDSHTVRVRLDDTPPDTLSWSESSDHKALFASDLIWEQQWDSLLGMNRSTIAAFHGGVAQLAKRLAVANDLTFEFTPFDGSPQIARFDIRSLDPHLHKVAEACGWAYE